MSVCDWKINRELMQGAGVISEQEMEGVGIYSDLKEKHIKKLQSRPKAIDEFMSDKGHQKMVHFQVCRTPVRKVIKSVINLLSRRKLEEVKQEYNYDDVFHLYLIVTFEDGERYELQKDEIVKIEPFRNKLQPESECKETEPKPHVSFNKVMLSLEKKYPESLYRYRAWSWNCQDFVKKFTNEAGTTELNEFVMQYFQEVFKPSYMRKIASFITDLGASAQRYLLGKGEDFDPY